MKRPVFAAAAIVAAAGILAGGLAIKPAVAADGSMTYSVGPFTLVSCSSAGNPCQQYKNSASNGIGVEGDAAKGTGVKGTSNTASAISVLGSANKGIGVKGASTSGFGVYGLSSTSYGVQGISSSSDGVLGISNSGIGVYGLSSGLGMLAYSYGTSGLYADSGAGYAVEAHGAAGSASIYAYPFGSGPAGWFDATGSGSYGLVSYSSGLPSYWAYNYNGNGADISGSYIGVIGRSPSGGFPFVATDPIGNNLFFVNGAGQVYAKGYNTFARTRDGGQATAFGSQSTSPTMEDNGTAQLVNGVATVSLNPTFAQTIDGSKAYQVMLTPDGDTRGLFIASKSLNGFVVREVQGGHTNISFDYHIYAPAAGQSNVHMQLVNHLSNGMPKSATVRPAAEKPTKAPVRHK